MKKYLVVGIGLFVIGCNDTNNADTSSSNNDAAGNTAIAAPTTLNYSIQKYILMILLPIRKDWYGIIID